ncbi:phosphopyruvate hydratase [Candidatus Babeliales bacterium]|nr:phosphopyruvate hydratase [Candidatus Babeliales bacterium]
MKITSIKASQILDSRGIPTIKCNILLDNKHIIESSVPSGASVGLHEAVELRDGDKKNFFGKTVYKAISNIQDIIAPIFINKEPDLISFDKIMIDLDGTPNKSKLGANAILAVSIAVARSQAFCQNIELYDLISSLYKTDKLILPKVMFNILNGGVHADNKIAFQEFMIMPLSGKSFEQNLEMSVVVYHNLKELLKKSGYSVGVGDEGGFAPIFNCKEKSEIRALDFLCKAVGLSDYVLGQDIVFCLDIAASQFYNKEEKYYLLDGKKLKSEKLIDLYDELLSSYPIYSIEDGLDEQDWQGWQKMTAKLGSKVQLVGDDIFVTNPDLIKKGIDSHIANACLIKPNQIGTVTETLQSMNLCKNSDYKTVVSHRSGETNDSFISDLVVGTAGSQFKAGAAVRGERVAKYNRLLEIERKFLSQ